MVAYSSSIVVRSDLIGQIAVVLGDLRRDLDLARQSVLRL